MDQLNFWRTVRRSLAVFLIGLLTVLSGWANAQTEGNVYPYASVDRAVGIDALERSQGVTTDGTAWIYSGKSSLVKISFDNETVLAINKKAIPKDLSKQFGSKHIGGISCCGGFVYAAIEDSKVWAHPVVALYSADTLEYTGKFVELLGKDSGSEQALTHGVPWVACDPDVGVFYVAQCDDAQKLFAYDLDTLEYVRTIALATPVDEIQGGEMYKGYLYVATNDDARAVYRINVARGTVEHYFDRILAHSDVIANFGGEGEDITVLPMEDGTLFHALNIGALFVDANLRHYAPVPGLSLEAEGHDAPEVRYLQKFVIDVLESGEYTLHMGLGEGAETIPLDCWRSGADMTYEMTVSDLLSRVSDEDSAILQKLGSAAKVRLILQGIGTQEEKVFLVLQPIGYIDMSELTQEELEFDLEDVLHSDVLQIGFGRLEFIRSENGNGYVLETYKDTEDEVLYSFYFTSRGLSAVETYDADTGERISRVELTLSIGVNDKSVFTPSGAKLSIADVERLFG